MSSYLSLMLDEEEEGNAAIIAISTPTLEEIDDGHLEDLTAHLPDILPKPIDDSDELVDLTSH